MTALSVTPVAPVTLVIADTPSAPVNEGPRELVILLRNPVSDAIREAVQEVRGAPTQTVIEKNGKTVTIATDADGRTTITSKEGGSGKPARTVSVTGPGGIPIIPAAPAIAGTGATFDGGAIGPPVADIAISFFVMCAAIVVLWPLARALGRRIERRGEIAPVDPGISAQLQRIEQAVEAMSVEVERISESQRFMAKLQNGARSEQAVLPGPRS